MKLFIFPDSVRRDNAEENIKLNIDGDVFHFFHNGKESIIDTSLLKSGSSTMVLNNTLTGETYVLYNFREILQVLGMPSQEMLSTLHQRGFMQIDKQGDDLFVKVFLLEGDKELDSDTNDFSSFRHYTKDYIHPLDYQYSWSFRNLKGKLEDGYLILTFTMMKSDFWVEPLYISHAGQSVRVKEGENRLRFKYIPTEGVYGGDENARQKGRAIDVARLFKKGEYMGNIMIQICEYADRTIGAVPDSWMLKIFGSAILIAISKHLTLFTAFTLVVILDLLAKFIALAYEMLKSEGNQTPSLVDSIRAIPAAHRARIINSHEMKTQFAGKIIVYIILVMAGELADVMVGGHVNFSQMVVAYLASTEILSIIENLDDAGVSAVHGLAALIHRKTGM